MSANPKSDRSRRIDRQYRFFRNCFVASLLSALAVLTALLTHPDVVVFSTVAVVVLLVSWLVNGLISRRNGGADFDDSENSVALSIVAILPPAAAALCVFGYFVFPAYLPRLIWILPYCAGQAGYFLHRMLEVNVEAP